MNAIKIEELTFQYPGAEKETLHKINLEISKGDFLAIVGNNGCGKSTLCKVLNGLIPHFISGDFQGNVWIDGENTQDSEVGNLAKKVGYVYQDFENQIVRPTVLDDASYGCMNYGMEDYLERGKVALSQCGLDGKSEEYIWQLSGGQTHLLALAGAVAMGPDILILDEPIAQLDPGHADKIYQVLKELNEVHGKTIIVIEHHTEYIADYCKNVLLLKNGHVEWMLPTEVALIRVEELQSCNIFPPQVTLASYALQQKGLVSKDTTLPTTIESGKTLFSSLERNIEVKKAEEVGTEKRELNVNFSDVTVSYRSVKGEPYKVFDKLNLSLYKDEKIALIGSNGAGKSTLMKMMVGLLKPSEGNVELNGIDVKKVKPEKLSKGVSLVYQNPEEMFIKDSIYGDIAYAMQVRGEDNWKKKTDDLLARFNLTELAGRDGRLLSGGQMRRASLAIGIALNPGILLLDEPTANLDIATRKEIMRTLNEMKSITETVMIATHDMQLVCEWADRIIVLCQGKVEADGTRDEIFGNKELTERVGIRPPEIFAMGREVDEDALCYTIPEFLRLFKGESLC